jgi:lipopolysaccharide export system ATP-binding protein
MISDSVGDPVDGDRGGDGGAPTPPRLSALALRVVLGGREVLREVSLDVREGEVLGVLGPSGAGKSTLFRALMGDEQTTGGVVLLEGCDVTRLPLWRRARLGLGYIPQSSSVFWDLTVRQNLATFQRVVHGARGRVEAARVEESAAKVELSARLDVKAGALSAGERRRLEFARAITRPPRVLICDEPFAGVDPVGAAHLGDLLAELARSGVAVMLADHHVAEALRVCTRALLLLDGAVATMATPEVFRDDPLVKGRYLPPS